MAGISAPNAALFDSDPLEQIYAKGTLSPNLAGLSALMLHAMQKRSDVGRGQYLGALEQTQALENMMGQRKIAAELQGKRMDNSRHLAERGYLPSQLTGGSDLFTDTAGGDAFAKLMQEELRSKIFSNMNKGSGAGSKDQVTVKTDVMPWGVPGATTITSRSTNAETAMNNNRAQVQNIFADMQRNPQKYTAQQKAMVINEMQKQGDARNPGIVD